MRWIVALLLVSLAGCMSEPAGPTPEPQPTVPSENVPFEGPLTGFGDTFIFDMPGRGGQGIWIHDNVLFWTNGGDLFLADVADPLEVRLLGNLTGVGARDVDVLEWHDRTYAAVGDGGREMRIIDVTDPTAPQLVGAAAMPSAGVHNLAAVPGTPYIYSSGASGTAAVTSLGGEGEGKIDVVDITDPFNPTVHTFVIPPVIGTTPVESDGCHDISVRADLGLAFCAGGGGRYYGVGGETFIWDISDDPTDPVWLAAIDDPRIKYHHQAFANDDGTILIIDDEYVGPYIGGVPVEANNCYDANVPVVGDEDQTPLAAAWIYDISDPTTPVQLAYVQNPSGFDGDGVPANPVEGNCGSHFGDLIAGQDAFVMGWYEGGTLLVDFSTPDDPQVLDIEPADGSHWDSRYWQGYVYHAGDDLVVTPLI